MTTRGAVRVAAVRVPLVTGFFWAIKILATTVGETAADFLNTTLGFGLVWTAATAAVLLVITLIAQLRAGRYIPPLYWWTVLLISVAGTLLTDLLTDQLGFPLELSTTIFALALVVVLTAWWRTEGTLSMHSIVTLRRESFYWATILITFALGTAVGDLLAERLRLGYATSLGVFALVIVLIVLARRFRLLGSVAAFWAVYVLTRPLGASLGDLLTADRDEGGLELGVPLVNSVFLVAIIALVAYLTVSGRDRDPGEEMAPA